jgi:phosphoglycolate phosphatase-like HAD superfamily hydrolase
MPNRLEFDGQVEFAADFEKRSKITHVLFDFDGTLSLIREGWPDVMVPMFVEYLPERPGESRAETERLMYEDIMRLTGKQTIFQMMQFAERVQERGGEPKEPVWYKHEYLRRLEKRITGRKQSLREGSKAADEFLVHNSVALLDELEARGLTMILASGTDEQYVKDEAELLGLTPYFQERIYGAKDDYRMFSKKMVIERLIQENAIPGHQLLSFGDGYVEIENTKEVGGLAVAVASDEANNGSGDFDEWKRKRLMSVGADIVIPDFRDAIPLLNTILGQ